MLSKNVSCRHKPVALVLLLLWLGTNVPALGQTPNAELKKKGMSGNPVIEGWYADPEAIIYGDQYWIYPTYSDEYEKQTFFDAFSSKDLVNWQKHSRRAAGWGAEKPTISETCGTRVLPPIRTLSLAMRPPRGYTESTAFSSDTLHIPPQFHSAISGQMRRP